MYDKVLLHHFSRTRSFEFLKVDVPLEDNLNRQFLIVRVSSGKGKHFTV